MALQELSLRDAMSRLEAMYQNQGDSGKILMRVLPQDVAHSTLSAPPPPVRPPQHVPDFSSVNPPSMFREYSKNSAASLSATTSTGGGGGYHHEERRVVSPPGGRSPSRRQASPPNENPWRLNYRVPKDSYGRFTPEKEGHNHSSHVGQSPSRARRSPPTANCTATHGEEERPPGAVSFSTEHIEHPVRSQRADSSSSVLSSQPTNGNKVPRYRYNPHDLTLSGPMSPPSPGNPPEPAIFTPSETPYATPSHFYTPPTFGEPRNRSSSLLMSPGASVGVRSARAHGNGPEMWSLQPKTTRYDAPAPLSSGPQRPTPHTQSSVQHQFSQSSMSPPRRQPEGTGEQQRPSSPTRHQSPNRSRVHVVSGGRGAPALVHSRVSPHIQQQQQYYTQSEQYLHEAVISPPRPPAVGGTGNGSSYRGSTPGRNTPGSGSNVTTPKRVVSTPRRVTGATPKRVNTSMTSSTTPSRSGTTTPRRSNRYNHIQAKISRVPPPARAREHYEPSYSSVLYVDPHSSNDHHSSLPRRECRVGAPFFASSSQPHHQHGQSALSPIRSSQARKGISWVVP